MDELEVLDDLERGLSDELESSVVDATEDQISSTEVQTDYVGDSAGGLDEGQAAGIEGFDKDTDLDDSNAGKELELRTTDELMARIDTMEGNVLAAVKSDSNGSETASDGDVTITDAQWDYLQGSLQTGNTFACFSLLITCALLGVLLFTHFFGRTEHA